MAATENWKELAATKRKERQDSIPHDWVLGADVLPAPEVKNVIGVAQTCGLLDVRDLEITENVDIELLLGKLAKGEWTAVEVTRAYYKRAIVAHQVTNCLTEIFVDRALAWAKDLDERLAKTGQVVGPLHGLPISLKDQFSIEGLDTTMGYTSWIGKKAEKNCTLVDILLTAGAVPFVRTNVPQTLMWPESFNNIFGRTVNPHNRALTSGGSSGGEGALISFKGSILGVGTDIGGSVRIPASCCGIYALRPSARRIPYRDVVNSLLGQSAILSAAGPLSTSLAGIRIFIKTVLDGKPWLKDPMTLRIPWDETSYQLVEHDRGKKLCFGFIWDEGLYEPLPPVKRALQIARDALVAAGHTVIDWPVGDLHTRVSRVASEAYNTASERDFKRELDPTGEPLITSMLPHKDPAHKHVSIAPPELADAETAFDDEEGVDTDVDAYTAWQIQRRLEAIRAEYLDKWNASVAVTGTGRPVDALISPTAPYPAPPHGLNLTANGTNLWNALDYPAAVVPVTRVSAKEDPKAAPHAFRNGLDKLIHTMYSPEAFENSPVGLQVIGRTHEDEAVIAMAEIFDAALSAHFAA